MSDCINILGVNISTLTMQQTVKKALSFLEDDKNHVVFTPNSEIIYEAYKNKDFADILNSSDINTADGIGVVYASKILKQPLAERVAGFDFLNELIKAAAPLNKRVFLFGSKPGVAQKAGETLEKKYPGIVICGMRNGYFKEEESEQIANQIKESGADIVLVCLGAPKQEKWIYKYKDMVGAKIIMGAGGSLDVLAGTVERAPEKWQKLGLEWAYRLKKEPKRIMRMTALPKFGFTVLFKGRRYIKK